MLKRWFLYGLKEIGWIQVTEFSAQFFDVKNKRDRTFGGIPRSSKWISIFHTKQLNAIVSYCIFLLSFIAIEILYRPAVVFENCSPFYQNSLNF